MTPIGAGIVEAMTDVAHRLAAKHGLIRNGTIVCWKCEKHPALMPSLHCAGCLQAHRDWNAGGAAHTVNAEPKTNGAGGNQPANLPPSAPADPESKTYEDEEREAIRG